MAIVSIQGSTLGYALGHALGHTLGYALGCPPAYLMAGSFVGCLS